MTRSPTGIPGRIILSRKGFDSKYGGCASPILFDGTMVSLPIWERGSGVKYGDLQTAEPKLDFGCLVDQLPGCNVPAARGAKRSEQQVHLDPDVRCGLHPRHSRAEWRALFGQSKNAERHLFNQGVGPNDLFLFFGWFHRIEEQLPPRFAGDADDEHVIWGWLQVERFFDPKTEQPQWAKHHPHSVHPRGTIYVGRRRLTFAPKKPGGGIFPVYHGDLRLTHPAMRRERTFWRLPAFFAGRLTYHANAEWARDGAHVTVSSAKIGQEFVFNTKGRERAVAEWLQKVFAHAPNAAKAAGAR